MGYETPPLKVYLERVFCGFSSVTLKYMLGKMRWVIVALIVAVLVFAVYFSGVTSQKAALSVISYPEAQKVHIDDQKVGETPYFSDQLSAGSIALRFGDFDQNVELTPGALTVVDWVLGPSEAFSAGHVMWFSKSSTGAELLVISKPTADVFLNDERIGESPLSRSVDVGEYTLEIRKEGYSTRIIEVAINEGFRLNISANLSLDPFPGAIEELSSPNTNLTILDLSSDQPALSADPVFWVKGAAFWSERDGEERDYDFFLTSEGNLYDSFGSEVSLDSLSKTTEKTLLGYLGLDGKLTSSAKDTLNSMVSKLYPALPKVQILETGKGYANVRAGAGISNSILGKAPTGNKYTYLGEKSAGGFIWFNISFKGDSGWVRSDVAKKL